MTTKLGLYFGLALFSIGLGLGVSSPASAFDQQCTTNCRQDAIECQQDCAATETGYWLTACVSACQTQRSECQQSC
jgi:hypothetical protein